MKSLKIGQKKTICINPRWTLAEWSLFVAEQTKKYGPRSILSAISEDAWHSIKLVLEKRE